MAESLSQLPVDEPQNVETVFEVLAYLPPETSGHLTETASTITPVGGSEIVDREY
jgi:hypothetical protein